MGATLCTASSGSLLPEHEVGHEVLPGFDHLSAVGGLAAGRLCGLDERGHTVSGNHIADKHGRGEQCRIDRERIAVLHAQRRRVEHLVMTGLAGVGPTITRVAVSYATAAGTLLMLLAGAALALTRAILRPLRQAAELAEMAGQAAISEQLDASHAAEALVRRSAEQLSSRLAEVSLPADLGKRHRRVR
jgi:hypothetical protein